MHIFRLVQRTRFSNWNDRGSVRLTYRILRDEMKLLIVSCVVAFVFVTHLILFLLRISSLSS